MPTVPQKERRKRYFLEAPSSLIVGRSFRRINRAKSIATKLRKKLFWTEGKSPERWTNKFISAKEKEESRIQQTPLFFCDIQDFLSFVAWRRLARGVCVPLPLLGEGTAAVILSIKMIFCG